MEGWTGDDPSGTTEVETHDTLRHASPVGPPLTQAEKLAAFFATVNAVSEAGCQVGYARITRDDTHGIDITFSLSAAMVRKVIVAFPAQVGEAEALLAGE